MRRFVGRAVDDYLRQAWRVFKQRLWRGYQRARYWGTILSPPGPNACRYARAHASA